MIRLAFCTFAALLLVGAVSFADYTPPAFAYAVAAASHIVDADVKEITKEGYAVLSIHEYVKGTNAATVIKSTHFTDIRPNPPASVGVKSGKRYIIMLTDSSLLEETTYYEVTHGEDGALGCRLTDYQQRWIGASDSWLPLDKLISLMKSPPLPKKEKS